MNEYRISSHNVDKQNGYINFNHFVKPMNFDHKVGFIFGEPREEFWFSLQVDKDMIKNFVVTSKDRIDCVKPICSGAEIQSYLHYVNGAKLISSIMETDYVYDHYGRSWENGFYTRQVWDLSEMFA